MKTEFAPAMRQLQVRLGKGRDFLRANPGDERAMRRLRAIGAWLAWEVTTRRMEAGLSLLLEMPAERYARHQADVTERIWATLRLRMEALEERIHGDEAVAAEFEREQERRVRESFLTDKEYDRWRRTAKDADRAAQRHEYYQREMFA